MSTVYQYDTEVNEGFASIPSTISRAISTIYGGTIAAAVDTGASLYNTLGMFIPGEQDASTADIMERIGGDPLRVYQEHQDAVQAASLIGGSVASGGIAVKLLDKWRHGSKSVNWLTDAGRAADRQKLTDLYRSSQASTAEYRNLLWSTRAKEVGNALVDTAAAEVAILGTMGAHPLMEDYFEDPWTNAGISLALGGVIGSGVNVIQSAAKLRGAQAEVESGILSGLYEKIMPTAPGMASNTAMQTNRISIANLGNIIEQKQAAGLTAESDLEMFYAQKLKSQLELEQSQLFEKMASKEILELPKHEQEAIRMTLESDDRMLNVNSVRIMNAKDWLTSAAKPAVKALTDKPTFIAPNAKGVDEAKDVVYFPNSQKYGSIGDIQHHGTIAASGETMKDFQKASVNEVKNPRFDYSLEAVAKSTPAADAEFGKWTVKFASMDDDAFQAFLKDAVLAGDDIPLVQAVSARLRNSPELAAKTKIKIADLRPYDEAVVEGVDAARTLGGTPVKYQQAAEALLNNNTVRAKYTVEGLEGIQRWINGTGVTDLAKGAYAYFARGYHARGLGEADRALAKKFANIYESPQSQQLRKDLLANLADKDGKIYLYRGLNAPKVFGQAPLESMAITPSKAGQFASGPNGKTMLYKIDVEDVVGALVDIGPRGDNVELIVRASARDAEAVLDSAGRIKFAEKYHKNLENKKTPALEVDADALQGYLVENKFKAITDLIRKGFPADALATRLNLPDDAVRAFMATDLSYDSFEDIVTRMGVAKYAGIADVEAAMSAANKPLIMRTSLKKNQYTQAISNLNAKTLNQMNDLAVSTLMFESKSPAVTGLADMIYKRYGKAMDMMRMQLGRVSQAAGGNKFFTSTDHYVREMGDIGVAASVIGKDLTQHSNNVAKSFLEPVSKFMDKIVDSPAALTEVNIIYNMNAGLSGWRIYKDGQIWQKVKRLNDEGKEVEVLEAVLFQGKEFKVKTAEADALLKHLQDKGGELYEMANVRQAILGERDMSNIGFWMPSFNPVNKHIAYFHDKATNVTQVIYGTSKENLEEAIATFAKEIAADPKNKIIVRKGDQQWWSELNGRLDPIRMTSADITKRKSGSGQAAVLNVGPQVLSELAGGYEHYINAHLRGLADLAMSDITDTLRMYSKASTGDVKAQSLSFIERFRAPSKDPAKVVHNTLLGHSDLGEYEGWQTVSNSFGMGISKALDVTSAVFSTLTKPIIRWDKKKGLSPEQMKQFDYEEYDAKLFEAGVINPFQIYEREAAKKFGVSQLSDMPDRSKRVISATNAMAATVALRFGDLAHGLVNLMSMPILTQLSIGKTLPETFMGVKRQTVPQNIYQVMSDGVRAMNSPRFKHLQKKWEELGYFEPLVSEATEVIKNVRSFEKGVLPGIERAVDSAFVKMMSKTSDWSEAMSRKVAMNTGYMLGKRLYPELDDDALTIFARDFMDKTQGNYSAAQRPVFFQGTAGMALGLFQTYMITMAQSIYRNIEKGDWGTLAKAAALQSGIFGTKSLPGFEYISETIGNNFSDDNYDLTTGTFRALGNEERGIGEMVLYGLPSALSGASIYTRGTVDPRLPNFLAGIDNIVGVNMGIQAYDTISQVATSLGQGDDVGQAMLEALSVQTLSRPLARGSELLMSRLGEGGTVNRQGNTVQTSDEVWTFQGIFARALASRPMEEARLREAEFRKATYDQVDREARQAVTDKLRTALRNGSNTPEKVSALAEEYFRNGGSPTGWRAAYRNAVARTNVSGELTFLDELDPEDPFNHMIDSLD